MTEVTDMGTVERVSYVGDSDLIRATCKHGDYDNIFKGGTERQGEKALAAHYRAKHTPPFDISDLLRKRLLEELLATGLAAEDAEVVAEMTMAFARERGAEIRARRETDHG